MTTRTAPPFVLPGAAPAAARIVFGLLARLATGTLDIQLPDGSGARFGSGAEPHAALRLADWRVCGAALTSGDIGFAECHIDGGWSTPDLPALLRLLVANRDAIDSAVYGSWWGSLLHRASHAINRNTRRGAARNIHAHYDIGNDFYRLWLDETMTYSSALFDGDRTRATADAQRAKMRRALSQCGIAPGGRLLEVGCGWGALAELAGDEFGACVTGITLSHEQLDAARERVAARGLQADLRLQDWRDITDAPFDAIVSIEMFEAVGHAYWPRWFRMLHERLVPGGRACVQSIVIRDDLYPRYLRSSDFIQRYIFPGGLLPSTAAFCAAAASAGFDIVDAHAFGADYAETLRRWRARFHAELPAVRALGFDDRFVRTWDFYLAYCEAAFDMGNTDVVQFTLQR